jgi:flagellar basal-body rod protein FlgC
MSLDNIFSIAGSGLNAQTVRLNTTASNMANAQSASSSIDQVYRARHPVFTTALNQANGKFLNVGPNDVEGGVQVLGIVESDAPYEQRYEPNHPMANEDGYVFYPNVNVVEEMANMISASRSFQTNVEIMNSAKQMMQRVLTIGQ